MQSLSVYECERILREPPVAFNNEFCHKHSKLNHKPFDIISIETINLKGYNCHLQINIQK